MNSKRWAVFFVALLSFDYARAATSGNGYYGGDRYCHCKPELQDKLDRCLGNIKQRVKDSYRLEDQSEGEYELRNGNVTGVKRFNRRGPYRCSLQDDSVIIFLRISFLKLLIQFRLSFVEDLLIGLLGGIGSALYDLLGEIVDFLLKILCTVSIDISLLQRFGNGGLQLLDIKISGLSLSFLEKSLNTDDVKSILEPAIELSIFNVINRNMKPVFKKAFQEQEISRYMITHYTQNYGEDGDE